MGMRPGNVCWILLVGKANRNSSWGTVYGTTNRNSFRGRMGHEKVHGKNLWEHFIGMTHSS